MSVDYKDYYGTLGVSKGASQDDIQRAYRKLARKYHPDINKTPEAEGKFKEINESYEVLKDSDKRSKYDRFGSAWKQAQRTGAPPPGFEDLFSQFGFGGSGGGGGGRGGFGGFGGRGTRIEFDGGSGSPFSSFFETLFGAAAVPGAGGGWGPAGASPTGAGLDHEAKITLSLEEAGRGGKREIQLSDPATGKKKTLRVSIPRGIRPGQKIRLGGQGGGAGGRRGDLYLTVDLLPHPNFKLDGANLTTHLPVTPWEAALGGEARIDTLDGAVTVRVPSGSSSGRKIRLRGKGFPAGGGTNGDLLAEIRVMVPETLTDEQRELFEQLKEASDFDPRRRR
jgi:curved DNA-binding protein